MPFLQGGKNRLVFYLNNYKTASSLLEDVFTSLYKISGFGNRGLKFSTHCGCLITGMSMQNRRIMEKNTETCKRSEGIDTQE